MRPFKNPKGSFYTMNILMIKLVVWLGWLSCVAVGQLELSEAVTGFVNFPEVGISCIGNLAVLITSISKGRLDLEMGVRDVLASTRGPILNKIKNVLTTCPEKAEEKNAEEKAEEKKEEEKQNEEKKDEEKKNAEEKAEEKNEEEKQNEEKKDEEKEEEEEEKASVLMLSYNTPNSSTKDFMKYISNAHKVHSILLQCWPLKSAPTSAEKWKPCKISNDQPKHKCRCIVIENTVEEIKNFLPSKMLPAAFKPLSDSQWLLLPSAGCLRKGCHIVGNQGTPNMEESSPAGEIQVMAEDSVQKTQGTLNVEGSFAACEILEMVEDSVQKMHTCICIPLKAAADDKWTKLLTKSFRSKDTEERRVSVMASDAMEIYTTQDANNTYRARKKREWLRNGLTVEFNATSLILPRLTEILINFLLVGWFKVDGFSSSMVARKAVKKYVVGSEKSGFAANAFLSRALVKSEKCDDNNATHVRHVRHVCQVLTFRPCFLRLRCLSYLAGTINLLCAAFWAVFIGIERYKWYAKSEVPSKPRVVVIIVAISFALVMDCWHLYLVIPDKIQKAVTEIKSNQTPQTTGQVTKGRFPRKIVTVFAVILCIVSGGAVFAVIVEILCIVSGGVGLVWGKIVFGKWVYSAVQALVWVKWGIGSYLLGESFGESSSAEGSNRAYNWGGGVLVYSSAFFLNSVLAGVRCEWKYLPSGSDSPANSPTMSPPG